MNTFDSPKAIFTKFASTTAIVTGLVAVTAMATLPVGSAEAAPIVIMDQTLVRGFTQLAPTTNGSYNFFRDNIGDTNIWQTFAIEVEKVGGNVNFKIFTNKGSDSEGGVGYSDFFINLQPNNAITGPFGNWDIGIDFQTGNVYQTSGPGHWNTSQQVFASNGSVIYAGLFRSADCGAPDGGDGDPAACSTLPDGDPGAGVIPGFVPVTQVIPDPARLLGTTTITIGGPSGNPYGAQNVISFSLSAGLLNGGDNFDLFWGTGECANDAIWGSVPPVPEPASLALFGFGLAAMGGISGLARRRAARA